MKNKINFEEFLEIESKLEITMGMIRSVERVPDSKKMLKLEVSFGDNDRRTVVTNIGNRIDEVEDLEFVTLPFITNLEPAEIMGITSEAMIMIAEIDDKLEIGEISNISSGSKLL